MKKQSGNVSDTKKKSTNVSTSTVLRSKAKKTTNQSFTKNSKRKQNDQRQKGSTSKRVWALFGTILVTLIVMLGISFAYFTSTFLSDHSNVIRIGKLVLTLDDSSSSGISLKNSEPLSDVSGSALDAYTFSISNPSSTSLSYTITLNDTTPSGTTLTRISDEFIRYQLICNGMTISVQDLTSRNIYGGVVNAGETLQFELRLWIKESATSTDVANKYFSAVVRITSELYQAKVGQVFSFDYTGDAQTFTAPTDGSYQLEVWGAQGGYRSTSTYGGLGGYSTGTVSLNRGDTLYVYVGGSGNTGGTSGGFNGGGARATYNGGGGGTDMRFVKGSTATESTSLLSRLIVAGGGGSDGASNKQGMYGGGTSGGSTTQNYGTGGGGATQTAGGTGSSSATGVGTAGTYGTFGIGGTGYYASSGYAGAGGGGWYGGAGSYPDSSADDDRGGGGGSGFVFTSSATLPTSYSVSTSYYLTSASTIAGNASMPTHDGTSTMTGNAGNGYAKITYLSS